MPKSTACHGPLCGVLQVEAVDMHDVQKAAYKAGVAEFRQEVAARKAAHAGGPRSCLFICFASCA